MDKTKAELSKQEEAIITAAHKLKPLKILLVEDNLCGVRLLPIFLEEFNHEVILANNGEEGIEIIRNRQDIDLILMDIQMPIMNGFEAAELIRGFDKEVIIIAFTAIYLFKNEKQAIEAVLNDCLQKPINYYELSALLIKYFGK